MGTNRTAERRKANKARRAKRRLHVAAENARLTAECQACKQAIRDAYRKEQPGEHKFTIIFRRNVIGTFDFNGLPVPWDGEREHPDRGIIERTREMEKALERARREEPN